MISSKDSEKCLGSWKVYLGEPDFYVLCHPSLTSGHWFGGSVQVGTVSPAGQDSRLPVVLLLPLPRCLRALPSLVWALVVSLPSCGSHCLCSSSRHLPGPCLLLRTIPAAGPCSSYLLLPSHLLDAMASSGPCWDTWALPRAQASLALWRFQQAHHHWVLAVGAGAGWCHVMPTPGPTVGLPGSCRFQSFKEIPLSLCLCLTTTVNTLVFISTKSSNSTFSIFYGGRDPQKQKNPELTTITVRLGAPPWPPPPPLRPKTVFREGPEMGTLQQCSLRLTPLTSKA